MAEHHDPTGKKLRVIKGKTANSIYKKIIKMGLLSLPSHAAYLGRELAKAEISLKNNLEYIQDEDIKIERR